MCLSLSTLHRPSFILINTNTLWISMIQSMGLNKAALNVRHWWTAAWWKIGHWDASNQNVEWSEISWCPEFIRDAVILLAAGAGGEWVFRNEWVQLLGVWAWFIHVGPLQQDCNGNRSYWSAAASPWQQETDDLTRGAVPEIKKKKKTGQITATILRGN